MRTDAALADRPVALAGALETLRVRGLELRRGSDPLPPTRARPAIPTGHDALDAALGTGGWPRGALASLDATPGSGATTLALGSLAACQGSGGLVAWVDLEGRLDPATAARIGLDLEWCLVVRPQDVAESVEIAAWLARGGLIDAFCLDLGMVPAPRPGLERLAALLARAGTLGLLLGGGRGTAEQQAAGVRVALDRVAWLAVGRDLVGQRVAATVTRNRWAAAGRDAQLDLWFAEGRRADPWLAAAATPWIAPLDRPAEERAALRVVIGA